MVLGITTIESMVGMMERKIRLNKTNQFLLLFLVFTVATLIRLYPIYQYSLEPASFNGYGAYRFNYLMENGHALPADRGEVILDKLGAIKKLVIALEPEQDLLVTTVFLSLSFSLVILLYAKKNKESLTPIVTISVLTFSLLANPDVIVRLSGWNGPYAWIFLFSSLYLILFKQSNLPTTVITILFLLVLPLTYYTESIFMGLILIVAFIYQTITKRKIIRSNLIILYIVFLLTWLIYGTIIGFGSILKLPEFIKSLIMQESRVVTLNYITSGYKTSIIKNSICIILASFPLVYYLLNQKNIKCRIDDMLRASVIAIFCLSIVYFTWMGLTGVFQRIPLYVILFSIISFALLSTSKINKSHYTALMLIVMFAVCISSYTYCTSPYQSTSKLTFCEAAGSHWLMNNTSQEDIIFTDLRLSGPFVAKNYPLLHINDIELPPNKVNLYLETIYYGKTNNPIKTLKQIKYQGKCADYLFFTKNHTKRFPGIQGYDFVYLPAPLNFLDNYEKQPDFSIIYRNSDITISLINNAP